MARSRGVITTGLPLPAWLLVGGGEPLIAKPPVGRGTVRLSSQRVDFYHIHCLNWRSLLSLRVHGVKYKSISVSLGWF